MEKNFVVGRGTAENKVPINEAIYRKNLEYYSGMGIYSDDMCSEKAFQISGYRIIKSHDSVNSFQF